MGSDSSQRFNGYNGHGNQKSHHGCRRGGTIDMEPVTVWSLSYLNMGWCLTLGEMILPILH
jgi:hypothetical protein